MTSKPTQEGQHGYQSACDPKEHPLNHYNTFSISFFKWEKKANKGLKKGKSFFKLVAPCYMRDAAFVEAEKITDALNSGWEPTKKQWTIQ